MGLFGTSADIFTDINLIIQYITLLLIIIGYLKRKPFKNHGFIMMTVTLLAVATSIVFMGPRLVIGWNGYESTIFAHAAVGIISIFLGAFLNFRFMRAMRNNQPLLCGSKNFMRIALLIWLSPIIGGTFFYVSTYAIV